VIDDPKCSLLFGSASNRLTSCDVRGWSAVRWRTPSRPFVRNLEK